MGTPTLASFLARAEPVGAEKITPLQPISLDICLILKNIFVPKPLYDSRMNHMSTKAIDTPKCP